jgi:hypothetical protein
MNLIESLERVTPLREKVETKNATYLTRLSWGRAYLHTIYHSIDSAILSAVAQELDFPSTLVAHFQRCNGAQLFVASVTCRGLHLLGCREKGKPLSRDSDEPSPTDIRQTANANRDSVVFGSYGFDGSMLMVDRRSQAVRCSYGRDLSKTRREWASIDDCLESEIQRMSQLFAPDGTCLVPCEGLIPTTNVDTTTHAAPARESTGKGITNDAVVPKVYCDLRGTTEWRSVPIEIYPCAAISNQQVGYRVSPDGRSLIGHNGWKEEWTVIGRDKLVGDPIFIDVRRVGFPVFTAAHGEGVWEPFMIARSAAVLFRTLDTLAAVRERRLDRETATTKLAALNGDADIDLEFWTVLIEAFAD